MEIEILLVDDFSTDNSVDIIKKMMLEDKRIKLIQNKKNKGTLYIQKHWSFKCKRKIYYGVR